MLSMLIAILLNSIVCDFVDAFDDDDIGSDWTTVETTPSTVSVSEFSGALQFNFGTRAETVDEFDHAGVLSNDQVLDMTQAGGITLDFVDTVWPSGTIDSIYVGIALYDGLDGEGSPNTMIDLSNGVEQGTLFMRVGTPESSEAVDSADLATFADTLVIWWDPGVGLWFGWSLLEPIDGGAWSDVFPDGVPDSLSVALFGGNGGLAETFGEQAGFTKICVMPPSSSFPDLCPSDVYPDYEIDAFDMYGVLDDWGTTCSGCRADVNADGQVNMLDLIDVLTTWGDCLIPT